MKQLPHSPLSLEADEILIVIRCQQRPLRLDDLLRVLDLPRREKKNLQGLLDRLADRGQLIRLTGGKWLHAEQARRVTGTLSIQRSGAAFVTPTHDSGLLTDIFVHSEDRGQAWHGDVVELVLLPGRNDKRERAPRNPAGRIIRVVKRKQTELTAFATRRSTARGMLFRPSDKRMDFELDVDISALPQPPAAGTLVRITINDEPGEHVDNIWRGTALNEIGREDDASVQERLVKINHQIPMDFPQGVLNEADALQQYASANPTDETGREDLRHIDFVTIDGEDARDFDDAIHVAEHADGWTLHVAIADVSWFVRPGSGLDREARERGNSCYFPLSVEPMLPEALSNDLCSLRPNEDRLVLATRLHFGKSGVLRSSSFMCGIIRSRARLTYQAVQQALDEDEQTQAVPQALLSMLHAAAALAKTLRAARMLRGALDMDLPEAAYEVDKQGRVLAIRKRHTLFSHQLIEECMLAANEATARFLEAKDIPFPHRVHPEPDPDRLTSLFHTVRNASLSPELLALLPSIPKASAIKSLLDAARDTPQAFVVNRLVLRSMMQARYAPEPLGHFGLASEAYCHFTSPIRRYADLLVHRAMRLALGQAVGPVPARHKLLAVADQCNARERVAQEAERETARRMACLLLSGREGEVFSGVISGVIDFGFFVELGEMPVEGMIRLARLDDDWYAYDPDRVELLGAGTGRSFRLGIPVTVRLAHVDLGRLEVDLELVHGGAQGHRHSARSAFSRKIPRNKRPSPTEKRSVPRSGKKTNQHKRSYTKKRTTS